VSAAKKDLGFVVLDHESFAKAPKTSIDYAVMERTHRAVVLTADVWMVGCRRVVDGLAAEPT